MKKNIEITVKKEKSGVLYNNHESIELSENNTVSKLILTIKTLVPQLKNFEIVKEELFYGTQLMKLEESVPPKSGIELEITVK